MAKSNINELVKNINTSKPGTQLTEDIKMGKGVTFSQEEMRNSSPAIQQKSRKAKDPNCPSRGYEINLDIAKKFKVMAAKEDILFRDILNKALSEYIENHPERFN